MKPQPSRQQGSDRKAKQLCRQVEQALQLILPSSADEVVRNLMVVAVEPAPNTGRLQVTVVELGSTDVTDRTIVLNQLAQANSWIRTQVAASIVRRRAPEVVFKITSIEAPLDQ
jgi:ribosome-binding factor A